MSIRSLNSLGRFARCGIFCAQAAAAPSSSVAVMFPAALGSAAGKEIGSLQAAAAAAPSSSVFPAALGSPAGKEAGFLPAAMISPTPDVSQFQGRFVHAPVFAMIAFTAFSAYYMISGEASAEGKQDEDPSDFRGKAKEGGLPASVNWVEKGAVTAPKDQGDCGSCWAHSVVGSVESGHQIMSGELVSLSAQQVIDCCVRHVDSRDIKGKGCRGGKLFWAYNHIEKYGLMSEKSYPLRTFLGHGRCRYKEKHVVAHIQTYNVCAPSEIALMKAVVRQPVVVVLDRRPTNLKNYKGRIITIDDWPPATKDEDQAKHGALVVGYGVDDNGTMYWLLKLSYGPEFGDNGYVLLQRGTGNPKGVGGSHVLMATFLL